MPPAASGAGSDDSIARDAGRGSRHPAGSPVSLTPREPRSMAGLLTETASALARLQSRVTASESSSGGSASVPASQVIEAAREAV